METEPHVLDIDELGLLLDEQEKIGKTFKKENTENMDGVILGEVLGEQKSAMEVTVQIRTEEEEVKQSNQVCFHYFS